MNCSITLNEFEEICRTCLIKKENLIFIQSPNIVEMLMECASLNMTIKAPWPHQICLDCLEELIRSFYFKRRCQYATEILEKIWRYSNHGEQLDKDFDAQLKDFWRQSVLPNSELFDKLKLELRNNRNVAPLKDASLAEFLHLISKTDKQQDYETNVQIEKSFNLIADDNESVDSIIKNTNVSVEEHNEQKIRSVTISRSQKFINHAKSLDGLKCSIASLKCLICTKTFINLITLARHLNTHFETRLLTFKCDECGKGFADSNNLKKHLNRHQGNPQYACEKCNRKFYDLSNLGWHMRKRHQVKPFKCNDCGMNLYHYLQQEQHSRLHEKKAVCDICGKICKTPKLVARHKLLHSNQRPYSCEQCDKLFKTSEQLKIHKKVVHDGPLPRVACSVCGKAICYRNLTKHLKSHDKRTFYKCEYCPKGYYSEETLKQHVRHKHTNKGCQFKWLCSICGRKVISPKDLKIHMKSHSQERSYQCMQCDKQYKTYGALTTHVRCTHEDKRPHVCSVCTKAFHTKLILQNHMRTHTGERPFVCTICGKAFGTKIVLRRHMKTHDRP